MVFRRRKQAEGGDAALRLYYASDIHGTEVLWLKFLNAPKYYKARVLVMGGDVTGKVVIPLVEDGDVWTAQLFGGHQRATTAAELDALERRIRGNGMYPYRTTAEEVARIAGLPEEEREQWFESVMVGTFDEWIALADERLEGTGLRCFVMPGNDDPPRIEESIRKGRNVEACDEAVVEFEGYTMLSLGYSNRTPWDSPRELDEDELYRRIEVLAAQVDDISRCIFNLHVPPVRLAARHRRRARRRLQHGADRQGAAHDPGRLDGRARGDRELPAARGPARPHPRVARARTGSGARCA